MYYNGYIYLISAVNVNSDFNDGYIYFRSYYVCIGIVLYESGLRLVENGYKIQRNQPKHKKCSSSSIPRGGGGRREILNAQTLKEL